VYPNNPFGGSVSIEEVRPAGVSRRTVIKAAAWSAPVVAVAVATPLASASTPPAPAPSTRSYWDGGTAINKVVTTGNQYIRVNQSASLGFEVEDENGDPEPAGKYTSGPATVRITWGAGGGVTDPQPYSVQETNLNGWVRTGSLPGTGVSGQIEYTYTGLLNGDANRIPLPVVRLYPSPNGALTATYVTVQQQSQYIGASGSYTIAP